MSDHRLDILEANEAEERRAMNVSFELPPFEAGMLLAVVVKERAQLSVIDDPGAPLRRTALENCYKTLTQQLSDWQKGRGDAQ